MTIPQFRKLVWAHYEAHGRNTLPWRKTKDPYKILVSELMLQQTQVERVIPYFTAWIKKYPTIQALSKASLSDVLISWQGLGYNRRAKMLHEAAKYVVRERGGKLPKTVEDLEHLPGVGHYTARAIAAFAYNQDVVFVETNLRTAVIHHFFSDQTTVSDAQVLEMLSKALPKPGEGKSAREWYSALMDYGAFLKRSGIRVNVKSKGYAKQTTFTGSGREVRGAIVRALTKEPTTARSLVRLFPSERSMQVEEQLRKLLKEGMVHKTGARYRLPH